MAEQTAKKMVPITIKRERTFPPKTIVATGFKSRVDKASGLIEISLETGGGLKGEKILFDPVVIRTNLDSLKKFVAAVPVDPDENAQKEDVSTTESVNYTNVIHMARTENRGETIFSCFSLHDWVQKSRQEATDRVVMAQDVVVVISTAAFQKKLILETILLISPPA